LCYTTIIYLYRYNPALLEERYRKPGSGEEEGWDKDSNFVSPLVRIQSERDQKVISTEFMDL